MTSPGTINRLPMLTSVVSLAESNSTSKAITIDRRHPISVLRTFRLTFSF